MATYSPVGREMSEEGCGPLRTFLGSSPPCAAPPCPMLATKAPLIRRQTRFCARYKCFYITYITRLEVSFELKLWMINKLWHFNQKTLRHYTKYIILISESRRLRGQYIWTFQDTLLVSKINLYSAMKSETSVINVTSTWTSTIVSWKSCK